MPALFLLLCVVVRHCFRAIEPKMTQKFVSFLLVLLGLCYTQWNCFATNPQTAPILYTKHTGISLKASARGVLQPLVLVSIIGNVPKSIISVLRSRVRCELDAQQGCRKNQFCLSGVVSRAGIALSLSLGTGSDSSQIHAISHHPICCSRLPLFCQDSLAPSVFFPFHIYSCWELGLIENN